VTRDDACWRVPDNKTTSATFVKYGWAWQCDSSQFWDGDDTSGQPVTGGACWSCPADYPRRTANAVFGKAACATPVNETAPAELLTYINCPKPDMKTMYPNRATGDQRIPGKPFLDIASGPKVGDTANGSCWACPVVDKDGNFLATYRSAKALTAKTGNQGCMITFKYKAPVVPEPGLSGLAGVKEVLFEKRIFARPDALTAYLYGIAQNPKGLNKSGADATAWVKNQWADIAQHPYQNAQIRALMMQYLLDQAPAFMYPDGKTPASPTPAEQQLINAFQTYIQVRRTFIARQALNMYDSWKHDLDVYNASHAQTLEDLSNYGSLPLDFKGLVVAATPTSVGVAVIGPLVGASVFKAVQAGTTATTAGLQGAEEAEELTLVPKSVLETGVVSGLVAGEATAFAVAGGALAIVAVAAVIGSIATDQLMQILTARDNLVSALNAANQPVSLSTLYAQKTGPDQVTFFWTLAMSLDKEQGDAQINSLAQAANAYAAKNNYAKPQ
jgi:hypothetical protein